MSIGIYVSVPIACFRVPRAREYFETFPCPPPSTVYGMLLSLIGEEDRRMYEGAEIAIGLLSEPDYSVVLRTMWRVKSKEVGLGQGNNHRPDFQELLTNIRLAIWIRPGKREESTLSLAIRVQSALGDPKSITRFSGLSLGESTHLVDEVRLLDQKSQTIHLLINNVDGDLALPIWPDHVGSITTWGQYSLLKVNLNDELPDVAWTAICRR